MTKSDITKEQLINLTKQHSYENVQKILHISYTTLNKLLKKFKIKKQPRYLRRIYPEISQPIKEYVLGSLLGDMSIMKQGPQHRIALGHSLKQKDYVKHQQEMLGELALNKLTKSTAAAHDVKVFVNNQWEVNTIKETDSLFLYSKVHPYFTELRNKLYPDNKKTICKWWLDQLTARSLAYWVMDDGSTCYSDNSYVVVISTYGFTQDEHVLLQRFLKRKFSINTSLLPVEHRGYGYALRFNTENSKKLRELIRPYVIDCMRYKIDRDIWAATRNK